MTAVSARSARACGRSGRCRKESGHPLKNATFATIIASGLAALTIGLAAPAVASPTDNNGPGNTSSVQPPTYPMMSGLSGVTRKAVESSSRRQMRERMNCRGGPGARIPGARLGFRDGDGSVGAGVRLCAGGCRQGDHTRSPWLGGFDEPCCDRRRCSLPPPAVSQVSS